MTPPKVDFGKNFKIHKNPINGLYVIILAKLGHFLEILCHFSYFFGPISNIRAPKGTKKLKRNVFFGQNMAPPGADLRNFFQNS
jgi:hypothetical protein